MKKLIALLPMIFLVACGPSDETVTPTLFQPSFQPELSVVNDNAFRINNETLMPTDDLKIQLVEETPSPFLPCTCDAATKTVSIDEVFWNVTSTQVGNERFREACLLKAIAVCDLGMLVDSQTGTVDGSETPIPVRVTTGFVTELGEALTQHEAYYYEQVINPLSQDQ